MSIKLKRPYDPAAPDDGPRILVDRLWPRGLAKAEARIDRWLKEIAPSDELRRWFGHEPERWEEFRRRYFAELAEKQPLIDELRSMARLGNLTLLFSARDAEHNNAVALKEYLEGAGGWAICGT